MYATVSIINVYKEGNLAIQQAGKTMSTKIIILCKKCPFVRRGEFIEEVIFYDVQSHRSRKLVML